MRLCIDKADEYIDTDKRTASTIYNARMASGKKTISESTSPSPNGPIVSSERQALKQVIGWVQWVTRDYVRSAKQQTTGSCKAR